MTAPATVLMPAPRLYALRNLPHRLRGMRQQVQHVLRWGVRTQLSAVVYRGCDRAPDGSAILESARRVDRLGVLSRRVITNAAVAFLVDCHRNLAELEAMNWHAMGEGSTAENVTDTALVTPVESRVAGTQSAPSANVHRTLATITATATRNLREHGVFSASTAGVLWDRSVFALITLATSDACQFTHDTTYSSGG